MGKTQDSNKKGISHSSNTQRRKQVPEKPRIYWDVMYKINVPIRFLKAGIILETRLFSRLSSSHSIMGYIILISSFVGIKITL